MWRVWRCLSSYKPEVRLPWQVRGGRFHHQEVQRRATDRSESKNHFKSSRILSVQRGKLQKRPITQEQLKHVLLQPDGSNTWPLHSSNTGVFKIKLVLPKGLTCDHCVIQWWWTVGNNWGCDDDGNCGVGLGKTQETFVNCADITISP